MNRQRLESETREEYHASMKDEQDKIDAHLKGNMVHVSKTFTWVPDIRKANGGTFFPSPGQTLRN